MTGAAAVGAPGMPADIRNGGSRARAVYQAGLAFEEQLIEQMTQSLDLTGAAAQDDDSAADDSGASLETSTLPQALAQSIAAAGGLGLAAQLAQPFIETPPTDG